MTFKHWLESRGMRLTPQMRGSLDDLVGQFDMLGGPRKKPVADDYSAAFTNPYTKTDMSVPVGFNIPSNSETKGTYHLDNRAINLNKNLLGDRARLRGILSHELIHSIDPKLSKPNLTNKRKPYYEQPEEFDAYSAQLSEVILDFAKGFIEDAQTYYNQEHFQSTINRAIRKIQDSLAFLRKPIRNRFPGMFDEIGQDLKFILDMYLFEIPSFRRTFLQRIYHALQDALSMVKSVKFGEE